jgi:gluconokinase
VIVPVIGVSGSGKSVVGKALAASQGWNFLEGDQFHPGKNLQKMARGEALTDADRAPYYAALRARLLDAATAGEDVVLACSALQAKHRALLNVSSQVRWVHLRLSRALIERRLAARQGHFFNPALLDSQLATFEDPVEVNAVEIDVLEPDTIPEIVARIEHALGLEVRR